MPTNNPFSSANNTNNTNNSGLPLIEDNAGILRLKYANRPLYNPLNLLPGELAYNYLDNTLYIGNLDNINNPDPIKIIAGNNSFINFLVNDISDSIPDKVPTSAAVALALSHKADLTHSNIFTGMNEYPYLKISTAAPSQQNITVTIKMLTEYIDGRLINISGWSNPNIGSHSINTNIFFEIYTITPASLIYDGSDPNNITYEYLVNHNHNTLNFEVLSIIETIIVPNNLGQNMNTYTNHIAPIEIINSNSFKVVFNYSIQNTTKLKVVYYA